MFGNWTTTVPNIIPKHKNSLAIEISRLIERITYSYYNIHARCACNAHTPVTRKPYGKKTIISNWSLRKNKYFHSHLENVSDLSIWQKNHLSEKQWCLTVYFCKSIWGIEEKKQWIFTGPVDFLHKGFQLFQHFARQFSKIEGISKMVDPSLNK